MNRGHVFAGSVGSATQRTYTLMGDTMNLAARVMGAAPPGMLYVTPEILDLSSSLFHTLAIDPFFVKGKTQLVQAYAVFEEVGVRPPSTVSELPFHGRDGELEFLVSLVTSCSVLGRGSIVTITGETGVGKSRLIAEVLADCPGLSTLRIQAEPNGRENPYWAFRDPLRGMLGIVRTTQADMESQLRQVISDVAPRLEWAIPLLGDVMHISVADTTETAEIDPQFRPERTAASVIELLSTINSEGFAIVVADGQWLDDASLFLLERLGIAAKSRPWTVIVTARSDDHHFAPMGDTIALQPLSDHAIRKIVIEATRAAPLRPHELEAVISRVGGNPLFLTETLRVIRETGYVDTIPETLDAVVSIQIDTLPSLTKQLLRYSSVLGRTFRRVVLDEFLAPESVQFDEATMRELERFIHDDGDERMQFRHAVVHEVAYGGLSFRKRRELHVRAGDVIERLAGDDVDSVAEYLATHYSLSSVANEKVWRYARVAADRARRAYANAEAAAQYGRALEAVAKLREIDASEVADIWARLGAVQDLTGQFEEARKAYGQALRVAGDDPVRISDLHLLRARTWLLSGRPPQARRNISLGRKHLIDAESHEQQMALARLQAYEAHILAAKGDPISAETVARSAAALAMSAGEEEALARAYGVIDWANFMMGRDEPRHGPEAIEIFERLGQLERSVGVKNNMGAFAFLEGEWDEAVEWYRQAVDAAERSGNVVEAARTRANLAEVLVGQRRHAEALPYLEDAERVYLASNAPQGLPFTRMVAARAVAGLGDLDSAIESLDLLFDQQLADGDTSEDPQIVVHLAEVLVRADRPTEALERVERFSTVAPEDAASVSAGIHRVTGMAYAKMGGAAAAITELELALHHALEEEDLLEELLSRETLGQIQTLSGSEPDFEHTARVSTLAERLGVVVSEPAWSS
jgi:tetratricopeptide (TPR) repeat protein